MIKIAIVENETEQAELLRGYVERYSAEKGINCRAFVYENGLDFLSQYRAGPDGIFMDILMPLPDGMKAAERLRRVDESVCLIFVTNMAQLAIRGYKVGAKDFLVKPVSYFDFSMEMDKIVRAHERRANDSIWVSTAGSMRRVAFSDICYIEILMHDVVIHTEKETLSFRGSLKNPEGKLDPYSFSRCNNCYLVNLQYVTEIRKDVVCLETGEELRISRPRGKQFLASLASYYAGGEIKRASMT